MVLMETDLLIATTAIDFDSLYSCCCCRYPSPCNDLPYRSLDKIRHSVLDSFYQTRRPTVQVPLLWLVSWSLGWRLHICLNRQLLSAPYNMDTELSGCRYHSFLSSLRLLIMLLQLQLIYHKIIK